MGRRRGVQFTRAWAQPREYSRGITYRLSGWRILVGAGSHAFQGSGGRRGDSRRQQTMEAGREGALTTNGDQRGEDQINLVVVQPKSSKPLFPPTPATQEINNDRPLELTNPAGVGGGGDLKESAYCNFRFLLRHSRSLLETKKISSHFYTTD